MFPEDRPAEDELEVRTVEEESLFRVAYPEVVDSYLRDKALAEENKTKSETIIYDIHLHAKLIVLYKHTTLKYHLLPSCPPPH